MAPVIAHRRIRGGAVAAPLVGDDPVTGRGEVTGGPAPGRGLRRGAVDRQQRLAGAVLLVGEVDTVVREEHRAPPLRQR
nr:hypothetical protein [Streptomyces fulvoviolaceus]